MFRKGLKLPNVVENSIWIDMSLYWLLLGGEFSVGDFWIIKVVLQFVYTRYVHTCVLGMCANCWNHVDIIVELGDVDIIDKLGYMECACLILLDKLIELILHYKNCNMLVWMFDTNMLVGNTRLFYMIGLDQLVVVPFLSFHYFMRAVDLV